MAAAEAAVHTLVRSIEAITTRSPVAIAAAAAHDVTLLSAGAVAGTAHLTTGSVSQLAATIHECRKEIARQRGQLDRLRDASRRQAA